MFNLNYLTENKNVSGFLYVTSLQLLKPYWPSMQIHREVWMWHNQQTSQCN